VFVAELPLNKSQKKSGGLMKDRNVNNVLEGTYRVLCEALNWSLKTDVQLNSFQLQIIDSTNTSKSTE
jgi:hypothetical protein